MIKEIITISLMILGFSVPSATSTLAEPILCEPEIIVKEIIKEVSVDKIVYVDKIIEIETPVNTITEKIVYQDNPQQAQIIKNLQEQADELFDYIYQLESQGTQTNTIIQEVEKIVYVPQECPIYNCVDCDVGGVVEDLEYSSYILNTYWDLPNRLYIDNTQYQPTDLTITKLVVKLDKEYNFHNIQWKLATHNTKIFYFYKENDTYVWEGTALIEPLRLSSVQLYFLDINGVDYTLNPKGPAMFTIEELLIVDDNGKQILF